MTFPSLLDAAPRLVVRDPFSAFLGAAEGGLLDYGDADVVRLAGHSCPTVAGAYLMTVRSLERLYPDEVHERSAVAVSVRQAIVDIARRNSLLIVKDDLFRPLASNRLHSLWSLYPEGCFHISSLSKVIAPGNRCGLVDFPDRFGAAIASALRSSIWMTDVISLTLVQNPLEQKKHLEFVCALRRQLTTRHSLALPHFGSALAKCDPESLVLWPDLDASQDFTAIALLPSPSR